MNEPMGPIHCKKCGAEIPVGEQRCWLCFAPIDSSNSSSHSSSSAYAADANSVQPDLLGSTTSAPVQGQMRLATMFLLMTLAAVLVAVFTTMPGIGILLAIASTPPLIRTMMVVSRRAQFGDRVRSSQKIMLFLSSLGTITVVTLLAVCSSIGTFCGICLSAV